MAIIEKDGTKKYEGCVFGEFEHMWADGMLDVFTWVWNKETQKVDAVQTGYYGCDGCNLMDVSVEFDLTQENAREMVKFYKREALKQFQLSVVAEKQRIAKGRHVEVVRGRKVPKGTQLEVFWVGEKPNYMGTDVELIAGCKKDATDRNEKPTWIKAEYLKVTDKIKSPVAKERDKFIKAYVKANMPKVAYSMLRNK